MAEITLPYRPGIISSHYKLGGKGREKWPRTNVDEHKVFQPCWRDLANLVPKLRPSPELRAVIESHWHKFTAMIPRRRRHPAIGWIQSGKNFP